VRENNPPVNRFSEASKQMNEAWQEMIRSGQIEIYQNLGQERTKQLIAGKEPRKGEKYIAKYLRAVQSLGTITLENQ